MFGLAVLAIICLVVIAWSPYLNFQYLKSQQASVARLYEQSPLLFPLAALSGYIIYTALALPGVNMLMLLWGAIFGYPLGFLLSCIGSTCGATLTFLSSRYFFQDFVKKLFPRPLAQINKGVEEEGAYYLFAIHMTAGLPFSLSNILAGVTTLRLRSYLLATTASQMWAALILGYAGMKLGHASSPMDLLSPGILLMLLVIAFAPLVSYRIYLGWQKSHSP